MAARHFWRASLLLAGLLAGCGREASGPPAAPAQAAPAPPAEGVFRQTVPFDAPYFMLTKMALAGRADTYALSQNGVLVKDFKVDMYRLLTNGPGPVTNALEMTVTAPECLVDLREQQGSSAGPLTAQTADGRFQIQGTGYAWLQKGTNATLTISNDVSTVVKNDLLGTNNAAPSAAVGGRFIRIHSHSFRFDRNANLITYRGHVHVDDEQLALDCDVMNIQRATNGPISSLVADGNIVIVDKFTGGRTTGEHAFYSDDNGAQLVTLTGNPYWRNGPQEATAQAFVFDKSHQTFRAEGDAHFKLPASSMTGSGFLIGPQTGAANPAASATNLVDVYAGAITLELPATTNGPIQGVIAEQNVRIVDPDRNSRASGDRAVYNGLNGVLTLSGKAQWQSDEGVARAELLTFDRTNLTFAALTNAYLKFPVATLRQSPAFAGLTSRTGESSNGFVEVTSDSYDYGGNILTFHRQVHAGLLQGDATFGTLDSGSLMVAFRDTNILRSIVADDGVHLHQPPTRTTSGKTVEADLKCERIDIEMRANTNGLLESASASGRVMATRTETSATNPSALHLSLTADALNASFMPDTNAIKVLIADHNVVMTRDDEKATGDKVVYTATNDTAVLTGHPTLDEPHGQMTAEDAIVYNHGTGSIHGRGNPQIMIKIPASALSESNLSVMSGKNSK